MVLDIRQAKKEIRELYQAFNSACDEYKQQKLDTLVEYLAIINDSHLINIIRSFELDKDWEIGQEILITASLSLRHENIAERYFERTGSTLHFLGEHIP